MMRIYLVRKEDGKLVPYAFEAKARAEAYIRLKAPLGAEWSVEDLILVEEKEP